jgi:hypothetical protein
LDELEESTEQDSFQDFASQALRLTRKGSFEQLLAQHLIQSVSMDPLNKVRLVLEAAFMVPKEKVSLDFELAETVYLTTLGFLNTNIQTDFISIAWGFSLTSENYDRFIKPWHKGIPLSFAAFCTAEIEEKRERLKQAETNAAEYFFLLTHDLNLYPTSFQALKSEFLRWTIPIVMQFFEKLSRLIDPDLYKEMLQILKPKAGSE